MIKFLKLFLILSFINGLTATFTKLNNNPLLIITALLLNILVFIGLWKTLTLVINNPEEQTNNKWIQLLRWILLFVFSIIAVELGLLIIFLFRFVIDRAYHDGNQLVISIIRGLGPLYPKMLILLGVLLSFPPLNLVSKAIKFSQPLLSAAIMVIIWSILMLVF